MTDVTSLEGKIDFPVSSIDTPCQTYYKTFGNISPTGPPPIIILHGGPGTGHDYCLPFSKLWPLYGIPVVFYDQIGCGKSTLLPQKLGDKSFWTFDLFIAELDNLVNHFHLNSADGPGFYVLGHSFGGRLAADFASRQPPGLRKLILSGTPASGRHLSNGILELKRQISMEAQEAIDEAVRTLDFTTPAYLAAMFEFCRMFLCRAETWPSVLNISGDATVRLTLQGPSPWVYTGILKDYSSIPLLPRINVPTMLVTGEFDTSQYEPTLPFFEHIPRVRWVTIANASHMPFLDSPELLAKTLRLVGDFLGLKPRETE